MEDKDLRTLQSIFKALDNVKLVYFFGSKAVGEGGPLSDYDMAVFADGLDKKALFELKLSLYNSISRALKTDNVDIVMLNITESPELKFNIIKEGKLIFEREPYRVLIEPRILNEYFDFKAMLLRYQLTKAQ